MRAEDRGECDDPPNAEGKMWFRSSANELLP